MSRGSRLRSRAAGESEGGHLRPWLRDPANILFAALLVSHVSLLWAFPYVPTQDGPSHLNNANVIREYSRPDLPLFREYYDLIPSLEPNWFSHLVLAGLMAFFSPLTADKVLLSLYVILLPLSVRYALSSTRPGSEFLSILAFPFTFNFLFSMGFYNFIFSLPVFFFVVGRCVKDRGKPSAKGFAWLSALALVLYFCHITTFVLVFAAAIAAAFGFAAADFFRADGAGGGRLRGFFLDSLRRVATVTASFLPGLILVLVFVVRKGVERASSPEPGKLLGRLLSLDSLHSHDSREVIAAIALSALFGLLLIAGVVGKIRERRLDGTDALLLTAIVYAAACFAAPDRMSGGEFISHRMNLFPFLALLLWFGAVEWPAWIRKALPFAAATIAAAFLYFHAGSWARINVYLGEYLSGASLVEPNKTLLPVCFAPFGRTPDGRRLSSRIRIFLHAAGYIAAERRVVDLVNYEANTDFFPTRFHAGRNPNEIVAMQKDGLESNPPCVDFTYAPERAGMSVDYVLVWGAKAAPRNHPCTQAIFDQLVEGYVPILAPAGGMMQLYRKRG